MKRSILIILASFFFTSNLCVLAQANHKEYYKTLHWDNAISPEEYVKAYDYIQYDMRTFKQSHNNIQGQNKWIPFGPKQVINKFNTENVFHGRIRAIKWWYNKEGDLAPYIGSSSGGLWYGNSEILLRNWESVGDNLPNPSISAIEMRNGSNKRIFVGTGDWGRYTGSGLYLTDDGGTSWKRVILKDTDGKDVIPNAITDLFYGRGSVYGDLYLSSSSGFFKSTDGGTSWIRKTIVSGKPSLGIFHLMQHPSIDNIFYAALPGNGLYRSLNSGESWQRVLETSPTKTGTTFSFDISQTNPDIIYLSLPDEDNNSSGTGIYRSTNGGLNFTHLTTPNYMVNGQGFHTNIIKIHPENSNIVYAGSVSLIVTTDGGSNWQYREGGHADYTSISFYPNNPNYVYLGSDGGIFVYDEGNKIVRNKQEYFQPLAPIQAYEMEGTTSEPGFVIMGTQDNGTMLSTNAHYNYIWKTIYGCDGGNNINIHPANSSKLFFNSWCGAQNPRLRSFDKGSNVEYFDTNMQELYYTPLRLNKNKTNFLFTVTKSDLFYSTNDGTDWKDATTGTGFYQDELTRSIAVSTGGDEVNVYAIFWNVADYPGGNKKMKIFTSALGFMTSKVVNLPNNQTYQSVIADNWKSNIAYIITNESPYRIYEINSTGVFLNELTGNLPAVRKYDIVKHRTKANTYYVATDLGVFVTFNDGAEWFSYQEGLPIVSAQRFSYQTGNITDTLRVATFGRGLWMRPLEAGDSEFEITDVDVNLTAIAAGFDLFGGTKTAIATSSAGNTLNSSDNFDTYKIKQTSYNTSNFTSISLYRTSGGFYGVGAICGTNGLVAFTTDRGVNWTKSTGVPNHTINDIHISPSGIGFFCDDSGYVYKTYDSGKNWKEVSKANGIKLRAIRKLDDKFIVTSGSKSTSTDNNLSAFYSSDSGKTFILSNISFPQKVYGRVNDIFIYKSTIFAIGEWAESIGTDFNSFLAKSEDNGKSWTIVNDQIPERIYGCFFSNQWEGWVCGMYGYAAYTQDGGKTWQRMQTGVGNTLNKLTYSGGKLIIVGNKVILRKDVSILGVDELSPETLFEFEVVSVNPNPANDFTHLKLNNNQYGNYKIDLFDNYGNKIVDIYNGLLEKGEFIFDIQTNKLPTGSYFISIHSDSQIKVKSIVVIH